MKGLPTLDHNFTNDTWDTFLLGNLLLTKDIGEVRRLYNEKIRAFNDKYVEVEFYPTYALFVGKYDENYELQDLLDNFCDKLDMKFPTLTVKGIGDGDNDPKAIYLSECPKINISMGELALFWDWKGKLEFSDIKCKSVSIMESTKEFLKKYEPKDMDDIIYFLHQVREEPYGSLFISNGNKLFEELKVALKEKYSEYEKELRDTEIER